MQNINRPEWTKLNYIGWLAFFKNNDKYRLTIDEFSLGTLSEYDKKLIAPSIAAFQCGEHSEGISLKKYAKEFSKLYNENIYATDSEELKKICNQMLHDELPHIVFQSYTISHFKQNISLRMKRRILMEITTIAVYFAFYKFFKKNSCSFSFFRKENLGYISQSEDIIKQFALPDVIKI